MTQKLPHVHPTKNSAGVTTAEQLIVCVLSNLEDSAPFATDLDRLLDNRFQLALGARVLPPYQQTSPRKQTPA